MDTSIEGSDFDDWFSAHMGDVIINFGREHGY